MNAAFDTVLSTLLDARRLTGVTVKSGQILTTVQQLKQDDTGYVTQLWDVTDTPVQLTHGDDSVSAVEQADDGQVFFLSTRPAAAKDPDAPTEAGAKLWVLPTMGEPRVIAQRTWGFTGLKVAANKLVVTMQWHSAATTHAQHEELAATRDQAKVTGVVYSQFPTRYWDQDLPQGRTVLGVAPIPSAGQRPEFMRVDLPPGRLLNWHIDAGATFAVVTMSQLRGNTPDDVETQVIYRVDFMTGQATELLVSTPQREYSAGAISPDGTRAVINMSTPWREGTNLAVTAGLLELRSGQLEGLWPQLDRWVSPEWLTNAHLVAACDDEGAGAIYVGHRDAQLPTRLTAPVDTWQPHDHLDAARAYAGLTTDAQANTDDDATVYAIASGIAASPQLVQFSFSPAAPTVTDPVAVATAVTALDSPGRLDTLSATAEDGTAVRSWLRLPDGEGPFPLVVFVHGGPWGSWNDWTYRWNPDPFVTAGYAVLLPDPAISTGYGQHMIDRGNQQLGGTPFTDLLALIDATQARPDIDAARTALAGGSYGGYLANWVAGHTGDRFRCIITHASLWDTTAMGQTTDNAVWDRAMAPQTQYSPHRHARQIAVPMLVIHGDKDYRVPIGQAHQLWHALHTVTPPITDDHGNTAHRYLYFPDEGHWILGHGNAEAWYRVFRNFLDVHVHGAAEKLPPQLG
ncbi:alpha/beta fold hydrolase [Enteractinococcus coprophilus]